MHDVLDPDDRDAGGVDLADGRDQFGAFALGQPAGDLVEQQQPRRGRERARHLQPLAFQQRQRARERVGALEQARAARESRRRTAQPRAPVLRRPWTAPTSRFSNTVRFSNGCGIW